MRLLVALLFITLTSMAIEKDKAFAGSCDFSFQSARDGSRCGARAKYARAPSSYAPRKRSYSPYSRSRYRY